MEDKGKWTCTLKNKNIPEGLQRKGCSSYKIGWGL
jgi:hypothetical protein